MHEKIKTIQDAASIGCLSYVVMHWASGFDLDQQDQFGATLLHWASLKGQLSVVKFLIDRNVDVNRRDENKQTPLLWAATENRVVVGKYLLEHGADPLLVDPRGCNAYFLAAMNGSLAFLHMLHLHRALAPDSMDGEQHSLMVWAAYRGHLPVVRYLHEAHKVSLNSVDALKRNALHWAAREGQTDCCVYLMAAGLSPHLKDVENLSALDWAKERRHRHAATALAKNQTSMTPVMTGTIASIVGSVDVLLHTLAGVVAVIFQFMLVTRWIPPMFNYVTLSFYGAKNMIFPMMYKQPIKTPIGNEEQTSLFDDAGVPRSLVEAMRGMKVAPFRRREQMNVTLFAAFLVAQYVSMSLAAGFAIPGLYWIASVAALGLAVLVKALSFRDVVPRGSALDDPLLKAVEAGDLINAEEPRIYPAGYYTRIPLRAYYCFELDAYFNRYDGWCLYFDCPIAKSNRRFYFGFIIAMFLQQISVLIASWLYFTDKLCLADENPFSLCSVLWHLFFSALPCREKPVDNTWMTWVLPSMTNSHGMWLILYTFMMTTVFAMTAWRHFLCIAYGTTRKELTEGTAPCTAGGLTSIKRGNAVVFSDGGVLLNCMLFLTGRDGARYSNAIAVPPMLN